MASPTCSFSPARAPAASRRSSSLGYHPPPTPRGVVPPPSRAVPDANPGTFYSAISNVDFEIGPGNAGAVAIRFHAAQHAFLSHIDFNIGSGFAGVHEVANEAEDLHFHGGQFGIMARKPSPAWQFTLIDSTFDGQREAAIRENEAGLTLVHDEFRNVPTAVSIDPHYSDQLWIKDSRFENITGPAVVISNDASRMTEINFENIDLQPRTHLRQVARERPRIPTSCGYVSGQRFFPWPRPGVSGREGSLRDSLRVLTARRSAAPHTACDQSAARPQHLGECLHPRRQRR